MTNKEPQLRLKMAKEMSLILDRLNKLDKLADKRVQYEEETHGSLCETTIDRLSFISEAKALINKYSHHM